MKRILLFVHSFPPFEFTGTPLIAYSYAEQLATNGYSVGVVFPNFDDADFKTYRKTHYQDGFVCYEVPQTERIGRMWSIFGVMDDKQKSMEKENIITSILLDFRPDVVQVIDHVNQPLDWMLKVKEFEISIVRKIFNAEDLCGRIEPFRVEDLTVCNAPLTVERCTDCCSRFLLSENVDMNDAKKQELSDALQAKREKVQHLYNQIYDRVLFQNESFREFFLKTLSVPREKILVIESGIRFEGTSHPQENKTNTDVIHFVYLGTLSERKGVNLLTDAFLSAQLVSRNDYTLTIAGNGDESLIGQLLKNNNNVSYKGHYFPSDIPEILRDADIGLSPSYFESFHGVTREYFVHGLPVIGSTTFGIPDFVKDGINGYLFPVGDAGALKEIIIQLLDHKHRLPQLTLNAKSTSVKRFEDEVQALIKVYEELPKPNWTNVAIGQLGQVEVITKELQVAYFGGKAKGATDTYALWAHQLDEELHKTRQSIDKEIERLCGIITTLQQEFEERTVWAKSLDAENAQLHSMRLADQQKMEELRILEALLEDRLARITRSPLYRLFAFIGLLPKYKPLEPQQKN